MTYIASQSFIFGVIDNEIEYATVKKYENRLYFIGNKVRNHRSEKAVYIRGIMFAHMPMFYGNFIMKRVNKSSPLKNDQIVAKFYAKESQVMRTYLFYDRYANILENTSADYWHKASNTNTKISLYLNDQHYSEMNFTS